MGRPIPTAQTARVRLEAELDDWWNSLTLDEKTAAYLEANPDDLPQEHA